jgi:hypothetical protein
VVTDLGSSRLSSKIIISALIRSVEAEGGFAAVLRRGDENAGAILVVAREKGANPVLFERLYGLNGIARWTETPTRSIENETDLSEYLARRGNRDSDLWIIELDIAFQERLADIFANIS